MLVDGSIISPLVPPSFSPYPEDSLAIEHSSHVMTCSAIGDPTPAVQWSKLGGMSFPIGPSLTLFPVSRIDTGFYTCIAINAAGSISATVYLNVYCEHHVHVYTLNLTRTTRTVFIHV